MADRCTETKDVELEVLDCDLEQGHEGAHRDPTWGYWWHPHVGPPDPREPERCPHDFRDPAACFECGPKTAPRADDEWAAVDARCTTPAARGVQEAATSSAPAAPREEGAPEPDPWRDVYKDLTDDDWKELAKLARQSERPLPGIDPWRTRCVAAEKRLLELCAEVRALRERVARGNRRTKHVLGLAKEFRLAWQGARENAIRWRMYAKDLEAVAEAARACLRENGTAFGGAYALKDALDKLDKEST